MIGTQCESCKNYTGVLECPAFEKQIPQGILEGTFIHDIPHPEQVDNDILYSPIRNTQE